MQGRLIACPDCREGTAGRATDPSTVQYYAVVQQLESRNGRSQGFNPLPTLPTKKAPTHPRSCREHFSRQPAIRHLVVTFPLRTCLLHLA